MKGGQRPDRVVRPLAYLTFALNYLHGGLDAFGFHVVNLCVHFFASVVLFQLTRTLLQLPRLNGAYGPYADQIALLAAVFWALHPLNVTAITYIVQRMASMAAFFYLLALYCYVKGRMQSGPRVRFFLFVAAAIAGMAGIATKENVSMLPVSILALEVYLIQPESFKFPSWLTKMSIALILIVVAYAVYIVSVSDWAWGYERRPFTLGQRLLTQPRVMLLYLGLLLYPTGSRLMLLHDVESSTGFLSPWSTLPALILVGAAVGFGLRMRRRYPLASFAILFFFLNHIIEGSFIPLEMVYEHRNYLPMVFNCGLVAIAVIRLLVYFKNSRLVFNLLVLTASCVLAANGISVYLYNEIFKSDLRLWRDNILKAPNLSAPHNEYAKALFSHGKFEEGLASVETSLRLDRFNNLLQKATVYYNKGVAYEQVHGACVEPAIDAYGKSLGIVPDDPTVSFKLALCYQRQGRYERAEELIQKALREDGDAANPN
jgi:hypothetical protein